MFTKCGIISLFHVGEIDLKQVKTKSVVWYNLPNTGLSLCLQLHRCINTCLFAGIYWCGYVYIYISVWT